MRDKVTNNAHRPRFLKRKESRSGFLKEPTYIYIQGPSAYQPNALPLRQTGKVGGGGVGGGKDRGGGE